MNMVIKIEPAWKTGGPANHAMVEIREETDGLRSLAILVPYGSLGAALVTGDAVAAQAIFCTLDGMSGGPEDGAG